MGLFFYFFGFFDYFWKITSGHSAKRLKLSQLLNSWAITKETEDEFKVLMQQISNLPMDGESFVLLTLICLTKHSKHFEAPEDVSNLHEVYSSKLQQHWQQINCHQKIEDTLENLSKMANILDTKKIYKCVSGCQNSYSVTHTVSPKGWAKDASEASTASEIYYT